MQSVSVCRALIRLVGISIALGAAWAQTGGLPPEWEVRRSVGDLAAGIERLKPILEQARPQEWTAQGAPEAYIAQWKTVRTEIEYLGRSTQILRAEPDRLTAALDAFLRLQRLEALLASLGDGIRRYQNAALADLLHSVFSEGAPQREGLRQYLVDLAETKERQFKVADQEAQRCRDFLVRQPPARSSAPGSRANPQNQGHP